MDRGVDDGLTFVASTIAARAGKASWILRDRLSARSKEKVLGRYPALSLKDARAQVRRDRAQAARAPTVHVVQTKGTPTPTGTQDQVPTAHWHNEIHPSKAGDRKLGDVWEQALEALFC